VFVLFAEIYVFMSVSACLHEM